MTRFSLAIAVGLLSAPVVAQTQPAAETAPEKKICKSIQPVGTLARPKKDCRTQKEWDLLSRGNQEGWAEVQGKNWAADNPSARANQAVSMPNGAPF